MIQFVQTFETGRMRRIKVNFSKYFFLAGTACAAGLCPCLLGLIHHGPLQCLRGIMSHARLSGSDGGGEFMSTDNLFLTLGEGKMLPNDKYNEN